MPRYGLGIDAGGTYTDTAIVDLDSGEVLSGNKALTTRNNLCVGIRNSISGLDRELLGKIILTSLSSTLATNSVVEGKGCRVGLICIGTSCTDTPADCYSQISGKFDFSGRETVSLDRNEVISVLSEMKGKIDALAVSGYISVRNPAHENEVREIASHILGVPVVCAHELTSKLGFEQRTVTAVMNARLLPVIKELIDSVRTTLSESGISAPLMIVKGDGSVMNSEVALDRPIETILSGPASSIMGTKALARIDDAMIIDIGGTTSDIGVLKNGLPRLEPEGASIAGKRTRVMAADISTFGIGGDSRILVNGNKTILSSVRVIPLCVASSKWASVKETLTTLEGITDDRSAESYRTEELVQDTEFFTVANNVTRCDLNESDRKLLDLIRERPMRLRDAGELIGVPVHSFSAAELESYGMITRIGVTPTDLLHAEGTYTQYDAEASKIAVGYLARKCSKTAERFIDDAKDMIVRKIASSAMEKAITDESGTSTLTSSEKDLVEHIVSSRKQNYSIGFNLKMPIIGIGAPVGTWLPRVAELLHTELIVPEKYSIGNAIGAITGSVSESVTVTIRANTDDLVNEPECSVFTSEGVSVFSTPEEALEYAKSKSSMEAETAAIRSGSKHPVIDTRVDETYCELSEDRRYFRGATVTSTATGKPDLC